MKKSFITSGPGVRVGLGAYTLSLSPNTFGLDSYKAAFLLPFPSVYLLCSSFLKVLFYRCHYRLFNSSVPE